jgi:signal transduction histidine kinase
MQRDLARHVPAALRRHPVGADAALAAVVSAATLVSLYTTFELLRQDPQFHEPAKPAIIVSLLVVTLPLALRRCYPLAVACVVIVAFVVGRVALNPDLPGLASWENYVTQWACWLALYSAVVHGRRARLTTLLLAMLVALLFAEVVREMLFYKGGVFKGLPLNQTFVLVYNAAFMAFPLLLGVAVRSRRDREQDLTARTAELQREREENARRAVLEERVRIARELHDVVAHHVSVMGVQAGAARRVMARQPEKAEAVLSSIEASSRQAVVELHRLLGFLRRPDQPDELAPQPDLAQIPELVAQAGQGGLSVKLSIDGEPRPLPQTLEVSAYRVIQEALTNALKHSGSSTASLRLVYKPDHLEVEVRDDGDGRVGKAQDNTGGHGLLGMRERVGLHGGHLSAGQTHDGFAVRATFPLDGNAG